MNDNVNLTQIDSLVNIIQQEINDGLKNIQNITEQEKTSSYWKIGKIIAGHLNETSGSHYGNNVIDLLAKKINVKARTLYLATQFYNSFIEYETISPLISWSNYKLLLSVHSEEKRKYYEQLLLSQKLTTTEFRAMLKSDKNRELLEQNRNLKRHSGIPGTYCLRKRRGRAYLDLGFYTYTDQFHDQLCQYDDRSIISVKNENGVYTFEPSTQLYSSCFFYKAYVLDVLDGDTLYVDIELGFHQFTTQFIRLRYIDTPELDTPEGVAVRDYVIKLMKSAEFIVIKTFQRDLYDRYVADVYFKPGIEDLLEIATSGIFLNQELLDKKMAVFYYFY